MTTQYAPMKVAPLAAAPWARPDRLDALWSTLADILADMSVDTIDRTNQVNALLDEITPLLLPPTVTDDPTA